MTKWVGMTAIKTELTQIHFLSDVLVAVASLDLKVPKIERSLLLRLMTTGLTAAVSDAFYTT